MGLKLLEVTKLTWICDNEVIPSAENT